MRFTRKKKLMDAYYSSDDKDIHKFLWFPVTIDGETRWLEQASIRYKVKQESGMFDKYYYWYPWQFLND